ncbi:hypothetical protein CCS41_14835 (plasmid) [Candidatus Fukatsuia symbiotica]|uniref:Uncharacterized protein n=1 Tax=Candidatus Fukatsuia symbiotica TaxID=1878942 RepID=A0A2U8I9E9_9GAMM|nr:hypothetical protein CCS41_14775 [Candidatus Fukatsuia symbiotica]AWK15678.1 hypothetical protein CCS41_14835 [Candidatus Fukatsuia symbiotica]
MAVKGLTIVWRACAYVAFCSWPCWVLQGVKKDDTEAYQNLSLAGNPPLPPAAAMFMASGKM